MEHSGITRRELIGGLAAGAAAPLLAGCGGSTALAQDAPAGANGNYSTQVAIVGAGYAGLACARALVAAGREVMILEARDRVGGRCVNQTLPAPYERFVVEGGAEFIGPTQDRIAALAQEVGVASYAAYNTGKTVAYLNGTRNEYTGRIPFASVLTDPGLVEAAAIIPRLNSLAAQVSVAAPWNVQNASSREVRASDTMSFQTWMDQNILTDGGKSLVKLVILALLSAEPKDVSLLQVLFYIASAGGDLNVLIDTAGGAQQDRLVNGSQSIALGLAQRLGDRIQFRSPVRAIGQDANGVTVSGDGYTVKAEQVVVAMSPWMAGRLRYDPLSPALQARMQLMQRVPMGSIWKVHAIYATPFWRDAGLNGQTTSDAFLPKVTFDNTPNNDPAAPGVMMGFIDGQDARDAVLMDPAARRQAVIDAFATFFGEQARNPLGYLEMNWQAEEFSAGGPTGFFPTGVLTDYTTALRNPIGRLHWAGTETSEIWTGYMDGAVRSGERAAQEILGG